jgi:chromosome segregation ATPase
VERSSTIDTLKSELVEKEDQLRHAELDKNMLKSRVAEETSAREKVHQFAFSVAPKCNFSILQLENELSNSNKRRDDLENQLTSITLQKDALTDEVVHVRKEMAEMRTHIDKVYNENASLTQQKYL